MLVQGAKEHTGYFLAVDVEDQLRDSKRMVNDKFRRRLVRDGQLVVQLSVDTASVFDIEEFHQPGADFKDAPACVEADEVDDFQFRTSE